MSMDERSGRRDLLYSAWHRSRSISRFLSRRQAALLKVVDIDWCEACQFCSEPLALIETQVGDRPPKPARITRLLAERAQLPAFTVSYVPNADRTDITAFRWRQLWPAHTAERWYTPQQYAEWLWSLRKRHLCQAVNAA